MKNIFLLLVSIVFLLSSCQSDKKQEKTSTVIGTKKKEQSVDFLFGEKLFKGKGNCYSCHRIAKKSIGPSIKSIMKIYKEENGDIVQFLKQKMDPIVDPANYSVMKTNFVVLEKFTEKELEALELYMLEVSEN